MSGPIVVTGGAGFIGSHTCKRLHADGFEPVVYDNLSTGHRDAVKWGPFVEGDILDSAALSAAIEGYRPRALIHFAASAYVGESVADPAKYYRNNVDGTMTVLDSCRAGGVEAVVFSSSCATYGIPDALPISEDAPQRPISPYGRTKLIGEQMLEDYSAAYGLRYVALRYFNASGADPSGELAERHDPETHLIPRALQAALGSLEALEVFGTDYPTADGTCVRDYIHVSDLANAHVLATRHLLEGGSSLKLNVGTGYGTSIRQVIDAIRATTDHAVPVSFGERRPGDPPALYADGSRARDLLGFTPVHSTIEAIVQTAAPTFRPERLHDRH